MVKPSQQITLMLSGWSNCNEMKQHVGNRLCLLLLPPWQNSCLFINHFSFWCKLVFLSGLRCYSKHRDREAADQSKHGLLASFTTEAAAISREDSSYCLNMSSQNSYPAEIPRQCKVMTSVLDSKQKAFSFTFHRRTNSELQHAKFYSIETANV